MLAGWGFWEVLDRLINADVNASYQIMKKVFEEKLYSIEGLSVVPVRLNVVS